MKRPVISMVSALSSSSSFTLVFAARSRTRRSMASSGFALDQHFESEGHLLGGDFGGVRFFCHVVFSFGWIFVLPEFAAPAAVEFEDVDRIAQLGGAEDAEGRVLAEAAER